MNMSQDLGSIFGKILRIDPLGSNSAGGYPAGLARKARGATVSAGSDRDLLPVEEAERRLWDAVAPLPAESRPAASALGAVLAERIVADRDFPPTDRSAMDGYAVRAADAAEPGSSLRLVGEVRAGQPVGTLRVDAREAARIMTGAIVPPGADAVVMVELTECADDRVTLHAAVTAGQHIRLQGEDLRAGETVLEAGTPIDPAAVAALASVGKTEVAVVGRPRVAVLSTGDEIVPPHERPAPHQLRDSNRVMLLGQLEEVGLDGIDLGRAGDTRAELAAAFSKASAADVLLVTGGVSMGEYDLVGEVLEELGFSLLFHRIAMRPGKPILAGRLGATLVIGLPGNPVSTFTGFQVLVAPALRKMMGRRDYRPRRIPARLARDLKRRPGRTTYHLASISVGAGGWVADPVRTMGSGDVLSMARANAFVVTPGAPHKLPAGSDVEAILWKETGLRTGDDRAS